MKTCYIPHCRETAFQKNYDALENIDMDSLVVQDDYIFVQASVRIAFKFLPVFLDFDCYDFFPVEIRSLEQAVCLIQAGAFYESAFSLLQWADAVGKCHTILDNRHRFAYVFSKCVLLVMLLLFTEV